MVDAKREVSARSVRTAGEIYARLKGAVILGGAVRPSALMEGIGRSMMDLPLSGQEKLFDRWVKELQDLVAALQVGHMELKVMLDAGTIAPEVRADTARKSVTISVARDPFEYRGTGGVLHDVAEAFVDEDYLLVLSGAQLLVEPLTDAVQALAARGPDVGILGHRDGTPSGLMLLRCGVLRGVSDLGFVDLKEQALPAIARQHRVVVEQREAVSLTVRTTRDYLTALRADHRRQRGVAESPDPFAEDCRAEFTVVEEGAQVDATARLFDSVVLAGGQVHAGAVLVRSVVCGGGVVKAGRRVVDELVAPAHAARPAKARGAA